MKTYFHIGFTVLGLIAGASNLRGATTETEVNFCNNNDEKIFISVAYQPGENESLMARGWWGLEAKKCSTNSFPVVGDKILVHAQSSSQIYQWEGDVSLCVNAEDAYDLEDAGTISCNQAGQEKRSFKELSLSGLRAAAENGIPKIEFNSADATRVGGGLKFCNDTTEPIYISFAQRKVGSTETTVNGWFMAKPGACFEANRDKEMDELLFFANSESGLVKWKGDVGLCTNDFDGFSHPKSESMDCTGNNLRLQHFTKAKLPTSGEFVHHFKTEEAYQSRSAVDICNSQNDEIAVAIAIKDGEFGQVISRGWYILKAGECSKNQVIDSDEILLHIESSDRSVLMGGEFEACVNNEKAFQYSQSTQMTCSGVDDKKVGFAAKKIEAGQVRIDVP